MPAPSSASIVQLMYATKRSMRYVVALTNLAVEFMRDAPKYYTFTSQTEALKFMDTLQANLDASYDEYVKE
jgi:hypothetical protein